MSTGDMAGTSLFSRFMRVLAVVTGLIGVLHVIFGVVMDGELGAVVSAGQGVDPVLDSQSRFFGALLAGNGVLLYRCLADLRRYAFVFRVVAGFIVVGGLTRLVPIALGGLPPKPVLGLIAVEVGLVPLVLWWHSRVLAATARITPASDVRATPAPPAHPAEY